MKDGVPMLHRTQILLKPGHYRQLKAKAQDRQQSLSALLREIIDQWLVQEQEEWDAELLANDPMWDLCGMVSGDDPDISENIDKYVYRLDWQESES